MCDGASQSAIAEWTPGLKIPTINAAFWYLEQSTSLENCNAARCTIQRKCTCNIRNGTMACDRYRFGSLSSFRVAPAGSTSQASLAPAVLPLTLRAAPISLYNHIIVFRAVVLPTGCWRGSHRPISS
jgi:hypothetical protein